MKKSSCNQTESDKKNEIIVKIMYLLSEEYKEMSIEDLNGILDCVKSKTQTNTLLQNPEL